VPGVRFIAALALAAILAGCGGSASTPPGLIAALGRSGTLVAQLEADSQSVVSGLNTGPAHDLNQLAASLSGGHADAQSVARIAAVLRHPSVPFDTASRFGDGVESLANEARGALIAPAIYRTTSGAIRNFLADWDDYVLVDATAFDQIAALSRSLLTLRSPLMRFLRAAREALAAGDGHALASARSAYLSAVWKLARAGALPRPTDLSTRAHGLAAKLVADQAHSADVRRLLRAVRDRYPLSFFAQHPTFT
jgi:hypothetical protein